MLLEDSCLATLGTRVSCKALRRGLGVAYRACLEAGGEIDKVGGERDELLAYCSMVKAVSGGSHGRRERLFWSVLHVSLSLHVAGVVSRGCSGLSSAVDDLVFASGTSAGLRCREEMLLQVSRSDFIPACAPGSGAERCNPALEWRRPRSWMPCALPLLKYTLELRLGLRPFS